MNKYQTKIFLLNKTCETFILPVIVSEMEGEARMLIKMIVLMNTSFRKFSFPSVEVGVGKHASRKYVSVAQIVKHMLLLARVVRLIRVIRFIGVVKCPANQVTFKLECGHRRGRLRAKKLAFKAADINICFGSLIEEER